jgi:hypothetical protein
MANKHQHTLLPFNQLTKCLRLPLAIVDFDSKRLRQFVGGWWSARVGGFYSRRSHRILGFAAEQYGTLVSSVQFCGAVLVTESDSLVVVVVVVLMHAGM